jgi:putative flippase GtrA
VFIFGIALLWMLVQLLGMAKLPAVALSFVAANSIHYVFSRLWIFAGTDRAGGAGYVLFFINAGVGLVVTMMLFWVFTKAGMNYLVGRVIASLFAGLSSFVLNAVLNFRSV